MLRRLFLFLMVIFSFVKLTPMVMANGIPIFQVTNYPRDAFHIETTADGHRVTIAGDDTQMAPDHFVIRTANGYLMTDNFRDGRQASSFIHATPDSPAAYLVGELGATFPYAINALQTDYPWVKILVIKNVPGGFAMGPILDGLNMIYDAGMATVLEHDSMVASAGTDVFMAGKYRLAMKGAKIGVHNFGGDAQNGEDEVTMGIRRLYKKAGIHDDFYAFMRSIPHESMHWMTADEIKRYNFSNATLVDIEKVTGANAHKN